MISSLVSKVTYSGTSSESLWFIFIRPTFVKSYLSGLNNISFTKLFAASLTTGSPGLITL